MSEEKSRVAEYFATPGYWTLFPSVSIICAPTFQDAGSFVSRYRPTPANSCPFLQTDSASRQEHSGTNHPLCQIHTVAYLDSLRPCRFSGRHLHITKIDHSSSVRKRESLHAAPETTRPRESYSSKSKNRPPNLTLPNPLVLGMKAPSFRFVSTKESQLQRLVENFTLFIPFGLFSRNIQHIYWSH